MLKIGMIGDKFLYLGEYGKDIVKEKNKDIYILYDDNVYYKGRLVGEYLEDSGTCVLYRDYANYKEKFIDEKYLKDGVVTQE